MTRKTPADRTQHRNGSFNGLSYFLKQPPAPRRGKTFRYRCKLSNFVFKRKNKTKTRHGATRRWQ